MLNDQIGLDACHITGGYYIGSELFISLYCRSQAHARQLY
jgi:hypothetical protein